MTSTDRKTARKAAALADGIASLRERAKTTEVKARVAEKVKSHQLAARLRHSAKLDRMLADQQEAGLKSGAYLAGRRQHPAVEQQCGCREFCR